MPFYNREEDIRQMKAVLSGEPNLIYFVYGPINSGKTALLMKVFEELSEEYQVFYINFRWKYVASVDDLLEVLFEVREGEFKGKVREVIKELLKASVRKAKEFYGIPISEQILDLLFEKRKIKNVFSYLESVFEVVSEGNKLPVFVLDEMQSIKGIINAVGKPVIEELFNFLVGLTKEKHLCHCLCATSDSLFIEDVYSNARLEGRAKYILVDDLGKEEAFRVYEEFGFKEKELVWEYIGGKLGDMVSLFEDKKRGLEEEKALKEMLKNQKRKLEWMLDLIEEGLKKGPSVREIKEILKKFKEKEIREYSEVKGKTLKFLIEENVLFYNPVEGTVRPQSRLLWKAIKELEL